MDVVVGPDAYRDLPRLLAEASDTGQQQMNVQLSLEETYADIAPVRRPDSTSAFMYVVTLRYARVFSPFANDS